MTIFGNLFASCISRELHAARFRRASEIRTKATPCVEVWQTSNLRRLRLGEEKRRKKEETTGQKYNGLPYSITRSSERIFTTNFRLATLQRYTPFMINAALSSDGPVLPPY